MIEPAGSQSPTATSPTQPAELPYYLEGGTPNVLGLVGMIAGLDFVEEKGVDAIRKHEVELCEIVRNELELEGPFEFFGHRDASKKVGTLSFRCKNVPAPELGAILDEAFAIAIRPGLHCAPYIHKALHTVPEGLIRISPGPFNSAEELQQLVDALREATADLT